MNKKMMIWILALILIIPSLPTVFAFGNTITEGHNLLGTNNTGATRPEGVIFVVNRKVVLQQFRTNDTGADRVMLINASGGAGSYAFSTMKRVTNVSLTKVGKASYATFPNVTLLPNTNYVLVAYKAPGPTIVFSGFRTYATSAYKYRRDNINMTAQATFDTTLFTNRTDITTNWVSITTANFTNATAVASNFTITAKDKIYNFAIQQFNVTLKNGTKTFNYTTTTGTVTTGFKTYRRVNITIKPAGTGFEYTLNTTTNWNTSINLNRNFTTLRYRFNITTIYQAIRKNFTATLRDTNGTETLNVTSINGIGNARPLINHYYNISVNPPGYAIPATKLKRANTKFHQLNFTLQVTNSINFTFINEITGAIVKPNNITISLISNVFSRNYTTTLGYKYLDLLTPVNYTIRYSSPTFVQRFFYFNMVNRSSTTVTLYMLSNSSAATVNTIVYDQSNNLVEGVIIKVKKFDISTNSYNIVEIVQTNFEGKAIIHPVLNSEYYKFTLEYGGQVVKETNPTYIYSTGDLIFSIVIGAEPLEGFFTSQGVTHSLSYNNATKNFRFTFNDPGNLVYGGCLDVYRSLSGNRALYNSSCVQSYSSTLLVGIAPTNGSTYTAYGYIRQDVNNKDLVQTLTVDFTRDSISNSIAVFMTAILSIVFFYISRHSKALAPIMLTTPLFLTSMLGIVDVNRGLATGFLLLGIIISYIMKE